MSLSPSRTISQLLPERSVLTMRAWDDTNPFLPAGRVIRDSMSGGQLPVLGAQRACVHCSLIGPTQQRLFDMAGIHFPANLLPFETLDDLVGLVSGAISNNTKIVLQFPPDEHMIAALMGGAGSSKGGVNETPFHVAPRLLGKLNDKAELGALVPNEFQLPRKRLHLSDLDPDSPPDTPVVLKAVTRSGTGGGLDVRICRDPGEWKSAVAFFHTVKEFLNGVVMEQYQDFTRSWCANFAVMPDNRGWFSLGVSEQVITGGHIYVGNVMGSGHEPPAGSSELTGLIARQAMAAGFCGIAGFDFAQASDGRLVCFDVNLRINGCTTQLLLHDQVCARIGAQVSRTLRLSVTIGREQMVENLRPVIEAGQLVPISFLDADAHPSRPAMSILTGLLIGHDIGELEACADTLRSKMSASR